MMSTPRSNAPADARPGTREGSPSALFRSLYQHAVDAALLHTMDGGTLLDANPRAEQLLGFGAGGLVGRSLTDLWAAHARQRSRTAYAQLEERTHHRFELDLLHRSGKVLTVEISASRVELAGETMVLSQVRDIRGRRQRESQLRHAARHDPLTDLPNRFSFHEHLGRAVERASRRANYHFALLLIDLDRFKTVNESLGHPVGDRLLLEVANRLRDCVGPGDLLARISGDEFAILVDRISGVIDARQMAERVNRALSDPVSLEGRELFTSAGIGITISNPLYRNADDCLRDADTALYRAKASGPGGQQVFQTSMHRQAVEQLHLEHALRQAIHGGEMELFFQPIVDLVSGQTPLYEALVRWRHPERGLLAPASFLPLAEETGLITDLDAWVLGSACHRLAAWKTHCAPRPAPSVAINVSSQQFARREWVALVREHVRRHQLPPSSLHLEVTEGALIERPEDTVEMLDQLRALGVPVALDDFGTGYSSLAYLHRFAVDTLKIDRSFVRATGRGASILESIVHLAHSLGMKVNAEGIETPADRDRIRRLNCDLGQGYFFDRPLDASDALRRIEMELAQAA